jgi:hypothetical protein
MEIFELELDVFKLFYYHLILMNSWAKNSWLKYLNLWSCSSTRYVIWINFIKFLCIQQTSTFITQELRIKSLKQFIKTYGPKQFHVIIFFMLDLLISLSVWLLIYGLIVKQFHVVIFFMLDPLINLSTWLLIYGLAFKQFHVVILVNLMLISTKVCL